MYSSAIVFGTFIFLALLWSFSQGSDKCYFAKTCVHDGKEKCGKDDEGNVRRFIDSCDIKEYNCIKNTDYRKTSPRDCKSLPSLEAQDANDSTDKVKQSITVSNEAEDQSKNTVTEAENQSANDVTEAEDESEHTVTESNESAAQKSEPETKAKTSKEADSD